MIKKRNLFLILFFLAIILNVYLFSQLFFVRHVVTSVGNAIASGTVSLVLVINPQAIFIHSPQNTTYNFNIGDVYTLGLNVFSGGYDYSNWRYTLEDLRHNSTVYNLIDFTPNVTFNAVRWGNKLTVFANDSLVNNNISVYFYINVPNSAPEISSLASNLLVCEDSNLSYSFSSNDIDEDNLYSSIEGDSRFFIQDTRINLTAYSTEIYSGLLNKGDLGVYNENIILSDLQAVDSKQINITVIEINHAPSITYPGVQTLWTRGENSTLNKQLQVNDLESGNQDSGNLSFNISFSGSQLFDISNNGVMSYTANSSYLGVHNITVCAEDNGLQEPHQNISFCGQDGGNLSFCNNFSLTITDENRVPEFISSYPSVESGEEIVIINNTDSKYFNITIKDPDGTIPDVYWYLDGALLKLNSQVVGSGSQFTIASDSEEYIHQLVYSSICGVAANKRLQVVITDGLLNASLNWTLLISTPACSSGEVISGGTSGSGGGGGGGGGFAPLCAARFGCPNWDQCRKLGEKNMTVQEIDYFKKECLDLGYPIESCGFQERECLDLTSCNKPAILESQPCYYTPYPSCFDGIKNCHDDKCEALIDCGGPCYACGTCSDGIQSPGEEGVDCGGQCANKCLEIPGKDTGIISYRNLVILLVVLIAIILFLIARKIEYFFLLKFKNKENILNEIQRLLKEGSNYIAHHKKEQARQIYSKIKKLLEDLPNEDKLKVESKVSGFYKRL